MIKEQISVQDALSYLNSLLKADQDTLEKLINNRELCNSELANHPFCQVVQGSKEDEYLVGLLGVLNGLFGVDERGWGAICAVYDENRLVKFKDSREKA